MLRFEDEIMIKRYFRGVWLLILCSSVISFYPAVLSAQSGADKPKAADSAEHAVATFHPISPGPADGRIAFETARMLCLQHYTRQKFDDTVSSKFLDRYLESLDPQHLHFTQSDLNQFERFRTNLDDLTLKANRTA